MRKFFALYYFSLLFGFSHLPDRLSNSTNSAKIAKNRGCSDLLHLRYFVTSLLFSPNSQRGLPNS